MVLVFRCDAYFVAAHSEQRAECFVLVIKIQFWKERNIIYIEQRKREAFIGVKEGV